MAYSSRRHEFFTGTQPVPRYRRRPRAAESAFPDLAPAEPGTSAAAGHLARIRDEVLSQAREIRADPAADNALSRLLVYALTAMLLILAFPVGFAMLMFNLLGGENLRLTLQVLALTGLAVTLSQTEAATRLLGLG
jgi:hypothetical protein